MISVSDAKKILNERSPALPSEAVNVQDAAGRVTAADVLSEMDVPSFDNSAMDGYALRFDSGKMRYSVTRHILAGDTSKHVLSPGETARIFTGAPLPEGADTVIQQELIISENGSITFNTQEITKGANVRLKGAQCKAGDVIVKSESFITPGLVALLCSVGITKVKVYRQPAVKVIVTGNELRNPGEPLRHGEIYNTNQPAVLAYLKMLGITRMDAVQVKDDPKQLRQEIANSLAEYDALILTGGISVGEHDYVQQILLNESVETLFYKIKQKPGKPMYAGMKNGKMIFGLPGNPAAVVTCFNQYVKPALLSMMGHRAPFAPSAMLPLAHDWEKKGTLANILQARVSNGEVTLLPGQASFNLLPFAEANAFVTLHENSSSLKKGDKVETYNW